MNKIFKKILLFIGIIVALYLLYIIIISVAAFFLVQKPQPTEKLPNELLILEGNIRRETSSGDHTYINEILKYEKENCNAKLYMYIYINNDSITKSKVLLDIYINSVNTRVNERLVDKKCIDSLIVDVSLSNEKVLKESNYRYSFPIIK